MTRDAKTLKGFLKMSIFNKGFVDKLFMYVSRKTGLKYYKETDTNWAYLVNIESDNKDDLTFIKVIFKRNKSIHYVFRIDDETINFKDSASIDADELIDIIHHDYEKLKKHYITEKIKNVEKNFNA